MTERGDHPLGAIGLRRLIVEPEVASDTTHDNFAFQNLWLAFNFDLREGLDLAQRVLHNEPVPAEVAPFAMLVVARFGTRDQMPLIEPLLKDSTPIVSEENEGERMSTQLRDVALAALIHLSGQDTKVYGFDESLPSQQIVFQPGKYGFANSAKRNLAHKKWSDWTATQQR